MRRTRREGLVRYEIRSGDGPGAQVWRVEGVRIGRFAVRLIGPDDPQVVFDDNAGHWRVDHTPTGASVAAFDSPEEAFGFADDISRFSASDPSSSSRRAAAEQVGEVLGAWVKHTRETKRYMPFREWFQIYAPHWRPPRMKMPRRSGFSGYDDQWSLF